MVGCLGTIASGVGRRALARPRWPALTLHWSGTAAGLCGALAAGSTLVTSTAQRAAGASLVGCFERPTPVRRALARCGDHRPLPADIAAMIRLSKTLPVSWWHIVMELERHGHTHAAIADAIDGNRSTVENWKNRGARPSHHHGERLIDLWKGVTGKSHEDLPRQPGFVSAAKIARPARRHATPIQWPERPASPASH